MTKDQVLEIYRVYVSTITAQEQRRYRIIAVYSTLVAGAWAILMTGNQVNETWMLFGFIAMNPIILAIYIISLIWASTVLAFRELAKAKFAVINRIEASFPVKPFRWEWEHVKSSKFSKLKLSQLDLCVPLLIMACTFVYQVLYIA